MIVCTVAALLFAGVSFADWVRWQPTDFKDNGNGTYTLDCLNYAVLSCANHYGGSTQPTPGDVIRVKGPDGVIGEFEILEVNSDIVSDSESDPNPGLENLPSTFVVSKM